MEAQFLTPLRVEHLQGRWWIHTAPLIYYSAILERIVESPTGFVFNGKSRPIVTYPTPSSSTHDLLYRFRVPEVGSWITADRVYNEAMKVDPRNIRLWTRWAETFVLFGVGWYHKKNMPGCMDPRFCKSSSADCYDCPNYYRGWSNLVRVPTKADLELMQ